MLEILKAIIYGIVEGVTEWLPISSTGHLILVEKLIPFTGTSENFFGMFDVVIQLGAILAEHSLGLHVCMEGIETDTELAKARSADPDYIQGFLFGRPCDSDTFFKQFVER